MTILTCLALVLPALATGPRIESGGVTLRLVPAGDPGAELPTTFERLVELTQAAERGGELLIPLPIRAAGKFEALVLPDVRVTLDARKRAFAIAGRIQGSEIALAGAWSSAGQPPSFLIASRPTRLALVDRCAALRGTELEGLDLGGATLMLADGAWTSLDALGEAGAWFQDAHASVPSGWSLAGSLPLAKLPAALRRALALPDAGEIALAGSLEADLDLLQGRGAIRAFELSAEMPVRIAGEPRRFRLSAAASAQGASLQAEMIEPWIDVLGLAWLDLGRATLKASSSGATLAGQLDLAGHPAQVSLALDADGVRSVSAKVGALTLDDLVRAGVTGSLPAESLAPLQSLVGAVALELREVSVSYEPRSRLISIAAQIALRGSQAEFLYVTEIPEARAAAGSAASSAPRKGSVFALRPGKLSLGQLFPRTLDVGALGGLADLDLEAPAFFSGFGDLKLDLPSIPDGWRGILSRSQRGAQPAGAQAPSAGGSAWPSGLSFSGKLPAVRIPSTGELSKVLALLGRLGVPHIEGLDFEGTIGSKLADLHLAARLPSLPASPELPWLKSGELALSIAGDATLGLGGQLSIEVGGERAVFLVSSSLELRGAQPAAFRIEGARQGPWHQALGIQGLELEDVRLSLALEGEQLSASCAAAMPFGSRRASVEFTLTKERTAELRAKLDRATLGDVVGLATRASRGATLAQLDSALELRELEISIGIADPPRVVARAKAAAFGREASWLFAFERRGEAAPAFALGARLPELRLSELVPSLSGSPADLTLPTPTFCTGDGWGSAGFALADPLVKSWNAGADLVVEPGLHLAAVVPLASIPDKARQALGLPASGELALAGSIEAELGLLSGKGTLRKLELHAELPGSTARELPSFLKAVHGGQRSFAISYEAPSKLAFGAAQEVDVELAGATRRFRLSAAAGSQAGASARAEMIEPWPDAFGLAWLDLSAATLEASASGARLEGRFELAGQAAGASIELDAAGPTKLSVDVERLALPDLAKSGVIDGLPAEISGPLEQLLGGATLELQRASLSIEPRTRLLTLAAQVTLHGTQSEFLYVTEIPRLSWGSGAAAPAQPAPSSSSSGRASLFALRPLKLSLGKLFPRTLQIEGLKELAGLDLDLPAFVSGRGNLALGIPDLPEGWRPTFTGLSGFALPAAWVGKGTPPSEPGASSGGSGGFRLGELQLPAGLCISARLPALSLPKTGRLAAALQAAGHLGGFELGSLDLHGTLGKSFEDLHLVAGLPPLKPNVKLPWLKGGELGLTIDGEAGVALRGRIQTVVRGEALTFTLDSSLKKETGAQADVALSAALDGVWKRPLGIEWLELRDVRLELGSSAGGTAAKCAASFALGSRSARVEIGLDGQGPATLAASLDKLALSDLIALVGRSGAGGVLEKSGLDRALELSELELRIAAEPQGTRILAAGRVSLAGGQADLLLSVARRGAGAPITAIALRLSETELSRFVPALRGTPGDLRFPAARLTFADGFGEGLTTIAPAGEGSQALDLARWTASGEQRLELARGLRISGSVPLAGLPPAARQALGLEDSGAELRFAGSIDATLGVLTGASTVGSVELRAVLPRMAPGKNLPAWMTPVESGEREVVLKWAPGAGVSIASAREVEVELAGVRRRFQMQAQASSGGGQATASFDAAMKDPWPQAFGLSWLKLESAHLRGSIGSGAGAQKALLEGSFELAGHAATVELEIAPGAGPGVAGRLVVRTDRLSLADVPRLGIVERLPLEDLAVFGASAPELTQLVITVELGAKRSLSFAARARIRDAEADVLLVVSRAAGGSAAPLLVLHPDHLSLGQLAPRLLENEFTRSLAERDLSGLLVLAGAQASSLSAADLPAALAALLPASTGAGTGGSTGGGAREVKLTPGLNLLAPLDLASLAQDGPLAQVLARLRSGLGVGTERLHLRGSLGRSAADLQLTADFPAIEPRKGPAWLKSGQLSLVITGQPSLAIRGLVEIEVDGETLHFLLSAALKREGAASPSIKLLGALETDRPWESPFGIEWLVLERVSLGLTLDATGSVTPAFSGKLKIGSKDLEVAAKLRISPAGVPIGGMFLGKSQAGFALKDLTDLQAHMASAASGGRSSQGTPLSVLALLPDVALRNIELKLAPRDEPDEHVTKGFALSGQLCIPARFGGPATRELASVGISIDREGLRAEGALAATQLGPFTLEEASILLVIARGDPQLSIRAAAVVLGRRQSLEVALSREKLAFDAQVSISDKWEAEAHFEAPFDLENPKFLAAGVLPDDLLATLGDTLQEQAGELREACENGIETAKAALEEARQRREARQEALGKLRARLQNEFKAAKEAVEAARKDALVAKLVMDQAYEAWKRTPDDRPVLKAAANKTYELAKAAYEVGSGSRKSSYETKQAKLAALPQPDQSPEVKALADQVAVAGADMQQRTQVHDRLVQGFRPINEFKTKNPAKPLVELRKGSFKADFTTLSKRGELPIDLELRWLDQPVKLRSTLAPGALAPLAREVLTPLFPKQS